MKLRGDAPISKTKSIPFVIIAVALILLGLIFVASGLMIEFKWKYELSVLYTPYWSGGFLVLAGISILLFVCVRKPSVAVFVSTISLPALAACIVQFILCALMAWALHPTDDKYLCTAKGATTAIACSCSERISFEVEVKGTESISNSGRSNSCEKEMKFVYELMIATACCCFVLAIILLWFILWVYCAVTRVTYLEQRRGYKFSSPEQGSVYHRATLQRTGGLVISNPGTLDRHYSLPADHNTFNRTGSFDHSGYASVVPHVTVHSSQTQLRPQSRSGTLKSTRAPGPPTLDRRSTSPVIHTVPVAHLDRRSTTPNLEGHIQTLLERRATSHDISPMYNNVDLGPPPRHTVPPPEGDYPVYAEDEEHSRTSSEDNTELRAKGPLSHSASVGVKVMNFEKKVSNVR